METNGQTAAMNNGIGNYKGIMLCTRPANSSTDIRPVNDESKVFSCGVVPEAPGMSVSILSKERVKVKKEKKDSVLTKHKKWLVDLQKAKEQLELDALLEVKRREDMLQRLADHSRKNRVLSLTAYEEKADSKDEAVVITSNDAKESNQQSLSDEKKVPSSSTTHSKQSDAKAEAKTASNKLKPAWALTEKASADADDELDEDIDSLLDFAQGLDYNKYINDIEIKLMIEQMKKRISSIETEIADDEKRDSEAKDTTSKKVKLLQLGNAISSLAAEESKIPQERNNSVLNVAKSMLEQDVDLQAVHSTRSVAAMIKTSIEVSPAAQPKVHNEPRVAVHEPNEGMRVDKFDVSNLPYLHRNPAI